MVFFTFESIHKVQSPILRDAIVTNLYRRLIVANFFFSALEYFSFNCQNEMCKVGDSKLICLSVERFPVLERCYPEAEQLLCWLTVTSLKGTESLQR